MDTMTDPVAPATATGSHHTRTHTPSAHTPPAPLSRREVNLVFAGLMVVMLLSSLGQMIFGTALPTIVGELDGVSVQLWVMTAFILASTVTMPVYGKLSDLIGRKPLIIVAVALFVIGSIVGGLAQDMNTLIVARVIQGLGGGGLMILSQATIAAIVPPKERGKYMGPMGAVFGVASVAGPLIGGWFTESLTWRWAFWMNIPLGVLALAAILLLLPRQQQMSKPRIDVAGITLMTLATTSLVLFTSWGGVQYEWNSPVILGLIAGFAVLTVAFVMVERGAREPIVPLSLFKDKNFSVTTVAGLIIGVGMFGAIGYLPTYMQIVHGLDATASGLLLIPMVGGMLVSSIVSGQIASRTAHYKWMPMAGTLIAGAGLLLLSTMHVGTAIWEVSTFVAVLGIGLGFSMQMLVLIVQNSFPVTIVGTATASNNFFRQIGATLGSAIVGSLFVGRLTDLLAERVPQLPTSGGGSMSGFTPGAIAALPDAVRQPILESYNDALTPIFLWITPAMLIAFVLLCFVTEKPLARTLDYGTAEQNAAIAQDPAEAAADAVLLLTGPVGVQGDTRDGDALGDFSEHRPAAERTGD